MNEKVQDQVIEIDIIHILSVLWKNALVIILVAVIVGGAAFGYTYMFVSPKYTAEVSMYVNSSTFDLGSASISVSSSQLTASSNLVSTYITVLESRTTMERVAQEAGLSYSPGTLSGMISATQINGTSAFKVTVKTSNPQEAELIANTVAEVLPTRISEIVEGTSVRVIDYAIVPSYRSSPSYTKTLCIGGLAGAVLCCGLIILSDVLKSYKSKDVTSADDVRNMFPEYAVLAVIPDMRYTRKGSYYNSAYGSYYGYGYGYGDGKGKKNGK